jgi:3-phenylpropionate/cinnamic acid dioxygenase small subunit
MTYKRLTPEEVADRIEINDLLVRYTVAIDEKDWDLLDTVYTPDAKIDYTTSGGIKGEYPEVREWLAKALAIFPMTQHLISNSVVDLAGDTATARTMVFNPMGIDKEGGGHKLFFVGAWYEDELVRTDDGWRIATRFERKAFMEKLPSG